MKINLLPPQNTPRERFRIDRQSNLELLRIVAMFLVLFIHYLPTRMSVTPETVKTDFWISFEQLELNSIAFVCVNCFVLITGYFGISWKLRSFTWLIWIIAIWALIAYICSLLIPLFTIFPKTTISGNPIILTFTQRWFIGAYLCLYIIAPLINSFIEKCSKIELGKYILVFYTFAITFGYLMKASNFNEGMSELSLVGLYLIGAYIKRYNIKWFTFRSIYNLLIYFGLGLLLTFANVITYRMGINKSLHGYMNPIIILESIYLFLFFLRLKIGHISIINLIAASTFSAYLFHHHLYIFPTYISLSNYINENSPVPLLLMIGVIVLIMLFCTVIDRVVKWLYDRIFSLLPK